MDAEGSRCERCGGPLAGGPGCCPACGEHPGEASSAREAWLPPEEAEGSPEPGPELWPPLGTLGATGGLPQYPGDGSSQQEAGPVRLARDWSPAQAPPGTPASSFGAPLASWGQRAGAMVLDLLVLALPSFVVIALVAAAEGTKTASGAAQHHSGGAVALAYLAAAVVQGIYFSLLNGRGRGQTVGNRAFKIAVRSCQTGASIGLARGILRWVLRYLLYLVFVLPGLLSDLSPLWDRGRQSFADRLAGSVVIRVR